MYELHLGLKSITNSNPRIFSALAVKNTETSFVLFAFSEIHRSSLRDKKTLTRLHNFRSFVAIFEKNYAHNRKTPAYPIPATERKDSDAWKFSTAKGTVVNGIFLS